MSRLFDLDGKVALVTGAARGMGRAMALALAGEGAGLLLVDRDRAGNERTAEEAGSLGRRVATVVADVGDPDAIRHLFESLDRIFGGIDFLANVAGGEPVIGDPATLGAGELAASFQSLVFGRFAMCQEAGRRMLAAGRGSIVNIASIAGVTALGRGHVAYSMAMGAVVQMTRELSTEWSGRGVRVNAILPAQVVNPGLAARMAADPGLEKSWLRGIPAGRLGRPDDIGGLAVFLASDASSWVTGALLPIDGGNLAANAGATHGAKARPA
jgi:NAD(P)-dependent dehydrogenase (short-subunit alcohol dehydrogenase family)